MYSYLDNLKNTLIITKDFGRNFENRDKMVKSRLQKMKGIYHENSRVFWILIVTIFTGILLEKSFVFYPTGKINVGIIDTGLLLAPESAGLLSSIDFYISRQTRRQDLNLLSKKANA